MAGRKSPPPREGLDWITIYRSELYRCRPPEWLRVTILVTLAAVDNRIPSKVEIEQSVRDFKKGGAGGPSVDNLKWGLWEATREKKPVRRR